MVRIAVLTVFLIAAAAPDVAAAACSDEIAETQARLAALEKDAAAGGPQESWFGEPSAAKDVKALLEGAGDLAQDGKEEACRQQLKQAQAVLGGLESKRDEEKAKRDAKAEAIKQDLKEGSPSRPVQ